MVSTLSRATPAPPPVVTYAEPRVNPGRYKPAPPRGPVRFNNAPPASPNTHIAGGRNYRRRIRRDTPYPGPRDQRDSGDGSRHSASKPASRDGSRTPSSNNRSPPLYSPTSPTWTQTYPERPRSAPDAFMREATVPLMEPLPINAQTPLFLPGSPNIPPPGSPVPAQDINAPIEREVFAWQPAAVQSAFPVQTRVTPTEFHSPVYDPNQIMTPSLSIPTDLLPENLVDMGNVFPYSLDDPTMLISPDVFN
ncbi:hypothetical protein EXIGLDRAFT_782972 [Exidia glandulosa HHB12029]|uniref:Uncharacterized protein n=1 Tax=Exidia glandulosa HHB12029 TaxID=1314781 RepID=A0A166NBM8_EXIGL|nr:hypothetical protein EXIGLDRAFT_782972 [Exidia glandulosa HHB12029]